MIPEETTEGDRLKSWILSRYPSVSEFSRALKLSNPSTLFQYISGRRRIGIDFQRKLRDLGAPVTWIVTGVDDAGWAELEQRKAKESAKGIVSIVVRKSLTEDERKRFEEVARMIAEFAPKDILELKELLRTMLKHRGANR